MICPEIEEVEDDIEEIEAEDIADVLYDEDILIHRGKVRYFQRHSRPVIY